MKLFVVGDHEHGDDIIYGSVLGVFDTLEDAESFVDDQIFSSDSYVIEKFTLNSGE